MKKALILASVASMIDQFNRENIKILQSLGYDVHVMTNFTDSGTITSEKSNLLKSDLKAMGVTYFNIPFKRSPFQLENLTAYRKVKDLMKKEGYSLLHCHSPIGGIIGRLAARENKIPTVIYTAHGFHFFKGASKLNWLIYYPIEKLFSRLTDILLTINEEDYQLASKKMKAKKILRLNGVGIDKERIRSRLASRSDLRARWNLSAQDILLLSVGELNDNKNQLTIIKALEKLNNPRLKYFIVGKGEGQTPLESYIKERPIADQVKLLGYCPNIEDIYPLADLFCFPSKREGMPVSLIEAMALGLPCLVSAIRGNNELIIDGEGGYLHAYDDVEAFAASIDKLTKNPELRKKMGAYNRKRADLYSQEAVNKEMLKIYSEI
ncbi:glycosyltransferase family 4 protein [Streptococcus oricebi]|uniref:Glycosyltransferase family 1 protein n=1 Tax=Streptococcus oricebi TaxID=1547447 RepID=A0ABS5B673_9STRE|nr:glycosyltransferase family 4 protein [Streptococcus oricebi]MBP2623958.1 glycosyltransferase family 1 protein [Streptococcus oricebi]